MKQKNSTIWRQTYNIINLRIFQQKRTISSYSKENKGRIGGIAMTDIKTKKKQEVSIKKLDRAKIVGQNLKSNIISVKDKTKEN